MNRAHWVVLLPRSLTTLYKRCWTAPLGRCVTVSQRFTGAVDLGKGQLSLKKEGLRPWLRKLF